MRICILANPRTGSSSLYCLLEKHLPKEYHCVSEPFNPDYMMSISDNQDHLFNIQSSKNVLLKHIYYQIPPKYDNRDEWLEWVFQNFDKVILLDRKDRTAQAESFVFHQSKNLPSWHIKRYYDINQLNPEKIEKRIKMLEEDGEGISQYSDRFPLYFYEDIFIDKNKQIIQSIFDYVNINPIEKYINRYVISDTNKVRITTNERTLL